MHHTSERVLISGLDTVLMINGAGVLAPFKFTINVPPFPGRLLGS